MATMPEVLTQPPPDFKQRMVDELRQHAAREVPATETFQTMAKGAWDGLVEGGQMLTGERPMTTRDMLMAALNVAGTGAFSSAALGAHAAPGAGKTLGAHVWQGGPHKYGPEGAAQSLQHISKGEGNAAYWKGRYDAGNPEVARQYQQGVKDMTAIKDINAELSRLAKIISADSPGGYRQFRSDAGRDAARQYDALMERRSAIRSDPGYLYKHDLPDEDIARYLDWDKPLSEQPQNIRDGFKAMGGHVSDNEPLGAVLKRAQHNPRFAGDLIGKDAATVDEVNAAFSKAGIPGLRYLDQGSRATAGGELVDVFQSGGKWQAKVKVTDRSGVGFQAPANMITTSKPFDTKAAAEQWANEKIGGGTHNYVTWDQDVLNRMKLLERNGETFGMNAGPVAAALSAAGKFLDSIRKPSPPEYDVWRDGT